MTAGIAPSEEEPAPGADRAQEALQDEEQIARVDVRHQGRNALPGLEHRDSKAFCFREAIHA
jgi:hypothetical protein